MELYLPTKRKHIGRFKKGHSPWNKGMKGINIGGLTTRFKPGQQPKNTLKNLAITKRIDRIGVYYKWIRVAAGKWVPLHRYIYTKHYGPLSPGDVIRFIDCNTMNCELNNLMKITRYQNLVLNRNREKAAQTVHLSWQMERLRRDYGLPLQTKLLTKQYK